MNDYILDFELPLKKIEEQIDELKKTSYRTGIDVASSIEALEKELLLKKKDIYGTLTRWQKLQLARHPARPYSSDYIRLIVDSWYELHGDRKFSDDSAIICGIGKINSNSVAIIAQEKGRGTKEKLKRNFGMTRPEGYRKALRVMKLAEKFNIPILTLIDTPGAYPGIGAEERGQAEAIARNIFEMSSLKVPIISIVIGEGASGGALAIGVCDKLFCMENTWFSVISPEGCASILFRDPAESKKAADAMKVSSEDLLDMGIADLLIKEPLGGANNNYKDAAKSLKIAFLSALDELSELNSETLIYNRIAKYDKMGHWLDCNE
ncbi:MAG: acetyl-CoA carboxylase carboxyl transferase subunit alpha [Candidatus Marinimicrobia bacterium]|nr:acetyl-CoA carboxylase carboxyl transferase subunit alpha [Candidatus Neomarinimicrobiota bacterium]|tara:strand:- start:21718 stop:22683 length:966 start_codon:yes stop_codon:yes gene_type:complete